MRWDAAGGGRCRGRARSKYLPRGHYLLISSAGPPRVRLSFALHSNSSRAEASMSNCLPSIFIFIFLPRISHRRASEIWAEVIPILAPVRAPSQAHTVKSPHWHCYSDHGSTEKDAGCAHAWLSLGPNLLSILQGSNHNNGGLAKSKEVGGLFIWLNKPLLNAQITTTGSSLLQRLSAGVDVSSDTKSDVTYDGMFITFKRWQKYSNSVLQ